MNELTQLIDEFRSEGEEIFDRIEELLLRLEQSPNDAPLLQEIFRGAHTIKGNAACLQFEDLTAFAHVVEEVLESLRSGAAQPNAACVSSLLEAVDAMRDLAARAIAGDGALTPRQEQLLEVLRGNVTQTLLSAAPQEGVSARQGRAGSLRVRLDKLNRMLDLTGEIAIARGQVRSLAGADERLLDAIREMDRLSFDLQELVMSARMVTLGPALRPLQRVARDVAGSQQKRVALMLETGDVEVDAIVVEQLRDPITHMIRNAVDHGIESPEVRAGRGKPAAGTIRIRAAHDRSGITIRLSDDGNGLDEELIARRALELGLEPNVNAIFEPGFSTAGAVTEISGRGVGMDVVRKNVEALRGTVSVASERGAGTTVTIRLPLTLTVIEGFAVAAAGETYVLPIDAVAECMALPASAAGDAFGVLNVRGDVLPFLRLRELFGLSPVIPSVSEGTGGVDGAPPARPGPALPLGMTARHRENVVVVQHDQGRAGIVVDELLGASDTVMKPMGGLLRQVPGVAGSSILGSGRVALVLDAREIVRCAIQTQSATQ